MIPDVSWLKAPRALAVRLNRSPHRMLYLAIASFLETIVVPIAIELVIVPFMLANRDKVWTIATVTLIGCLAAAIVGYGVGWLAFESVGRWLIETSGYTDAYGHFVEEFNRNGFWAIVIIGITPLPFPIAMLAAGSTDYSIPLFLLACSIARGVRYYGVAALVQLFGSAVLHALENPTLRLWLAVAATIAALAALLALWLL